MFTNNSVNYDLDTNYPTTYYSEDERFFLAPFLIGGLAGTALGYGIANNNQLNHSNYYPVYPMMPVYYSYHTVPIYSNNYYY